MTWGLSHSHSWKHHRDGETPVGPHPPLIQGSPLDPLIPSSETFTVLSSSLSDTLPQHSMHRH